MSDLIERLIRPEIRAISAYHVPEAAGLIKMDAMENPYPWPEAAREEWLEVLRRAQVNLYPDPRGSELQAALREAMGIPSEMGLLLGNGSDELIQMLALAVAGPGRTILALEPGFVMYRMIGLFAGLDYIGVPLRTADFSLDLPAVLAAIEERAPALVFIAYPNNPTGNLFETEAIERIIAAAPGLVIVDEAYAPFTDASFVPRLGEWPNLLVMRTVSKMGLAGLRLGYLAGAPALLAEVDKVRLPYNVNVLTQASVTLALRHRARFDEQCRTIREERVTLMAALTALAGVKPFASEANFILIRLPEGRATQVFEALKASGILVKNLDGAHPQLADCLRVTVGRPEENRAFVTALSAAV
ncbi:histidinol-phosphate aminotransferase [Thioflavicoccus mobilis 8321]|uniref:Histidinol-phosphate aminotransferase n=1 Tax=Thioflavicoccus mobilis 8321 TaxID=765912 RepID=L0H066_9GAMM|nr:histidinol-phosphate transaminase [Thioflavicoccus mobilis]AGA91457.1 histidinol-phosphate aminotransferase [Thioflavicoccus mobilis 8321]